MISCGGFLVILSIVIRSSVFCLVPQTSKNIRIISPPPLILSFGNLCWCFGAMCSGYGVARTGYWASKKAYLQKRAEAVQRVELKSLTVVNQLLRS